MAKFQSLRLPLAILSTIPGVLCGVVLMLLFTGTTLNIQSFMGAIMAVGISVANSILLVSFAEQTRYQNQDVETATRTGATSRSGVPCPGTSREKLHSQGGTNPECSGSAESGDDGRT
jgi:multidrug efflux pump subunit AcrB